MNCSHLQAYTACGLEDPFQGLARGPGLDHQGMRIPFTPSISTDDTVCCAAPSVRPGEAYPSLRSEETSLGGQVPLEGSFPLHRCCIASVCSWLSVIPRRFTFGLGLVHRRAARISIFYAFLYYTPRHSRNAISCSHAPLMSRRKLLRVAGTITQWQVTRAAHKCFGRLV